MKQSGKIFVDDVEVVLVRRKMKNVKITVKENGNVVASAPASVPIKQVALFVEKNIDWINKTRQERLSRVSADFISGNKLMVLGKEYVIKFISAPKKKIKLVGEEIVFFAPQGESQESLKILYLTFCKRQLKKVLPEYFQKWSKATGLEVKGFSVRDMQTRWGSCNPRRQTISINVHITEKPLVCLDYLVLHEIAHILEPSHNQNFKNFLSKYMPDWKIFRKMLKK